MAAEGGPPVRIAMVHSFYSSAQPSGENTVVLNEVDALRRAGHEVALFAAHTDDLEGEVFYKLRAGMRVATGYGRNPLKAIKEFSPDVVHVHNLFPNYGRRWVEDLDAPLVHTLHNYRPICANGLLFRDGQSCTLCIDGHALAALVHSCYRDSRLATLPLAFAQRGGTSSDALLRHADATIVLSPLQRDLYRRAGVPDERMAVSPNFLPDDLDPGPTYSPGAFFLGVGRLSPEKGFAELARRWPSEHRLVIVGDGPDRQVLERIDNPAIELKGAVCRNDVLDLMREARALIFPSRSFECAPLVHVEALAAGTPVAAAPDNSVAATIEMTGGGSVVPWADWGRLLPDFPAEAEHRREARRVFEEHYTESAFTRRATALYARLKEGR